MVDRVDDEASAPVVDLSTGPSRCRHSPGPGRFTTTCGTLTALAPGQVSVCTASYTVAARDLAAAQVRNTASASADGQVDAVTASATSKLKEEPSPPPAGALPDTGARDLHRAGLIGLALVCTGRLPRRLGSTSPHLNHHVLAWPGSGTRTGLGHWIRSDGTPPLQRTLLRSM